MNKLYVQYRQSRAADVFEALYDATRKIREMNRSIITQRGIGDEADALEIFDDVLLALVSDNVPDFSRALNVRLRRRRIDLLRKTKRKRARQRSLDELIEQCEDDGTPIPEILRNEIDVESINKEADQRQLIDSMVRAAKPDAATNAIVTAYLTAPASATPNAIAKSLGHHHEFVKRKLTALARQFDANRFGDYRDYLVV